MLEANEKSVKDINALLRQLSEKSRRITKAELWEAIKQDMLIATASHNFKIVGMASVYFRQTLMGKFGIIEDVVVDESHLGRGIGDKLITALIREAKKRGVKYIELTCNPTKRIVANKLYQKHGFKLVAAAVEEGDTNYYRLYL